VIRRKLAEVWGGGDVFGRRLVAALAMGLLVRIAIIAVAWFRAGRVVFLVGDSYSYLLLARALAGGGGFTDRDGNPEIFRTPGYPLFLTPGMLAGWPVVFALVMQLMLSASIIVLTFAIAERVTNRRVASICALAVAIEPTLLAWSLRVMPETLLTTSLLLFTWIATQFRWKERETRLVIAAAVALVMTAYVKPVAYPFVLALALGSFLTRAWRSAAIFALTSVLLLLPWHIRNARVIGYAGFSTVVERTLYLSGGGSILAKRENLQYADVRLQLIDREEVRGPSRDPERLTRMRRQGLSLLASDPLGYALIHAKGMVRTLFDPGASEYLRFFGLYSHGGRATAESDGATGVVRRHPLLFWSSVFFVLGLLPLAVLPLVAATRLTPENRGPFLLFACIAAFFILAGGGVPGTARLRTPAVPFLILMSGLAVRERRPAG
jgi:4-amino-4-deoxy-L-arabinose transferase-like glycosyltransferase